MRILIVDDTKSVHAFMDSLFEGEDHELVHVYTGQEGLDTLAKDPSIQFVFLDWEMPGLTGVETLKKIRETNTSLPVVMVTSRNAAGDLMEAIKAGASEYVMKPFTKDILFEKLETVLKMKAA